MRHIFAAVLLLAVPAMALTPEEEWKKGIEDENTAYAQTSHAMLKIQDSAYIGEGQSATLSGRAGDPSSWKWGHGPAGFMASIKGGKLNISLDGKPVSGDITKGIALDTDIDVVGQPTQVGANVMGWRLFVYNQRNPVAKSFKGVAYYPFNPAFRVQATFTPDLKLPPRVFKTSRGTDKQFYHAGEAHFTLQGKPITLPFYTGSNKPGEVKDMSAFFTDKLTGKGAYGAGRYVDVAGFGPFPPRAVTIDFNQAYNPNCARSAHFTCPVAVDDIAVAMTAGEKDPHYHGP
jgi:uncharacterized protein (DUF1684 family)